MDWVWTDEAPVGRGTVCTIYLAHNRRTGTLAALKRVSKEELGIEGSEWELVEKSAVREGAMLKVTDHPHIEVIYDLLSKPGRDVVDLLLEYIPCGDLHEYILTHGPLNEDSCKAIFLQVGSAIAYCHARGIVHRDVKLDNVMLTECPSPDAAPYSLSSGTPCPFNSKLVDFGFSNMFGDDSRFRFASLCGTPQYLAPELFLGMRYEGPPVDVYSLGVVLYRLLTGEYPYGNSDMSNQELAKEVARRGDFDLLHATSIFY